MECPVCGKSMVACNFGAAHVDVCASGCKSLWFDCYELAKLDEHDEGAGFALAEALRNPRDNSSDRGPLRCPKCAIPMFQHLYQRSKEVNIDECYNCGGFFLDSGELHQIRDTYMSKIEREDYRKKLLSEIPEYTKARKSLEIEKGRSEAILRLTRVLRLSYWLGED
jgi:Zn-finger nucleic acid-binding protein